MILSQRLRMATLALVASGSADYWERRYRSGLTSGLGSYGALAEFKAEVINGFVRTNDVQAVVEFGCGDGHQLVLSNYPRYLGLDVSKAAIDLCRQRFGEDRTKSFLWYDPERSINLANFLRADLTLSLDVIYHLTEDSLYQKYLDDLFCTSARFVVVYSSDQESSGTAPHVKHRNFTVDVKQRYPEFRLIERVENRYPEQSFASFFAYERRNAQPSP
jgi:hypothetical protein